MVIACTLQLVARGFAPLATLVLSLTLFVSEAVARDIRVAIDEATPIQLSEPAEGVAIGNPAIATVSVESEEMLFVTGRSYGTTNVVVVGASGRVLYSGRVVVAQAEVEPTPPRHDAGVPGLAASIEGQARALSAQDEVTPEFLRALVRLASDAEILSGRLRMAGVEQDLPTIFHGISEDILARANELERAVTPIQRDTALVNLRGVLDDTILIAPMAAAASADARASRGD